MFIWLLIYLVHYAHLCLHHTMFFNSYMLIKFCCAFDDLLFTYFIILFPRHLMF